MSEHGNDRGVLECVGGRFVLGWWRACHPGLDAGAVQAKMPTSADSGSGPGMTAGLLHRDCSGDASSDPALRQAQGPGEFLMTVFLFWDGGVAYRGAAGIGGAGAARSGGSAERDQRNGAGGRNPGKRLKNGLLAIF